MATTLAHAARGGLRKRKNRVFDFLDSGHPLTIPAEGKSYVLPPVNVPRWRMRFQKIC